MEAPLDPNAQAPVGGATGESELVSIPITPEQITEWRDAISQSRDARKQVETKWDLLLKEYLPVVTEGAQDLKAGIHFRNVHSKKPKLFYREPDLILEPEGPLKDITTDPLTGMVFDSTAAAAVKQAVLNKKLGRKGAKAKRAVGQAIFDILAWSGIGCTKIGYRATTTTIQKPVMVPDPNWVPPVPTGILNLQTAQPPLIPAIDPLTGQPQTQPETVIIHSDWYWTRFSPKKLLIPSDLRSCMFDEEASWMGMEFFMPESVARSTFKIPEGVELKASAEDDRIYQHVEAKSGQKPKKMIHGVELFYKATVFDKSGKFLHPEQLIQLVMFEGENEKVFVHRPSPDQTIDELGQMTPDSMIGFPYVIFTNRDSADTPYVWADNAFTNSSVKHINTHRQQSVKLRDVNIGKYLVDSGAFTPDEVERMKNGAVGEFIMLVEGRLREGADKLIAPITKNEPARDDWRTAQTLKQDVEETLGIGGVNAGNMEDTARTATEISTSSSALADRLEDEQGRILEEYLSGVEKFDALLQRYASDLDYVRWVGQDGVKRLAQWNKQTIAGKWAYSAKPNSQLRIDVARVRAQKMQFMTATAPFAGVIVNMKPIIKSLATDFGLDPNEVILPDPPPGMVPPMGGPVGPVPGAPPAPPGPTTGSRPAAPEAPPRPHVGTGGLPNAPQGAQGTPEIEKSVGGPK